ncbi:hypothetical protein [Micromonospora sp. NPDC001898]|uniref:hypothetical protein n=1 Tax=Micromonospora sp. NPDC001898 TaxID=3364221 RepID=UPI003693B069
MSADIEQERRARFEFRLEALLDSLAAARQKESPRLGQRGWSVAYETYASACLSPYLAGA